MARPTGHRTTGERERELSEVLWRFEQAHPLPSGEDARRWAAEHPDFADDIVEYAVVKAELFLAPDEGATEDEADDGEDLREAADEILAVLRPDADAPDLLTVCEGAGQDLDELAERLDIEVSLLEQVATGRFAGNVPTMIVYGLADALGQSVLSVVKAINAGAARPRLGHASATGDPAGRPFPSIDEQIEASDMSEERKRYWLRDD